MMIVKVSFNGELRRLAVESENVNVSKLHETFRKIFGDNVLPRQFVLRYKDDEGDFCVVTSDKELQEAVRLANGGVLRFDIVGSAASTPSSPAPASSASSSNPGFRPDDAIRQILSQFDLQTITKHTFFTEVLPALTRDFERYLSMVPSFVGDFERDMREFEKRLRQQTSDAYASVVSPAAAQPAAPVAQPVAQPAAPVAQPPASPHIVRCTRGRVAQSEVVHNAYCDNCKNNVLIKGIRYKCTECPDYDLCGNCKDSGAHNFHTFLQILNAGRCPYRNRAGAEAINGSSERIHMGVMCDGCNNGQFIRGIRYKCSVCPDYDLCLTCKTKGTYVNGHSEDHLMVMTDTVRRPCMRRCPVVNPAAAANATPGCVPTVVDSAPAVDVAAPVEPTVPVVAETTTIAAPVAVVVEEAKPVEVPLEETFEHLEVHNDAPAPVAVSNDVDVVKMSQLEEMGFLDQAKNAALLVKFNGDLLETVKALLE